MTTHEHELVRIQVFFGRWKFAAFCVLHILIGVVIAGDRSPWLTFLIAITMALLGATLYEAATATKTPIHPVGLGAERCPGRDPAAITDERCEDVSGHAGRCWRRVELGSVTP